MARTAGGEVMDVGLVGSWTSDPEDLDGIETFGRVSLEFSAGGSLTYTIHGDRGDQTSLLTYVAEGGVIETDQPSQPRRERTAYELTPDGRLMLWFGRQRSVYLRASGATTTPGIPGEPGSARSSILSVVRRGGTSDAVAVEDDGRVAYAYLRSGQRPGLSRMALKDGPLARVLATRERGGSTEMPVGEAGRLDPAVVRERVASQLRSLAIPVNSRLPLADAVPAHPPQQPEPAARRTIILYALTGLAQGARPEQLWRWLLANGLAEDLTPSERGCFHDPLSAQALIDLSWKQEALFALAWAGSLVDTLTLPVGECDLDGLFPMIPPEVETSAFLKSFQLRSLGDLIHQADLHFCLHWVVRHPEVRGESEAARRLSLDVIRERRHTLEWLVGNSAEWDEVALDT